MADFDIFIAGGAYHFARLRELLPKLAPHGRVHLASITLNEHEMDELRPYCNRIHQPRYDPDGYRNFGLFCTREINRLLQSNHFIKLDADVELESDWIRYVDDGIRAHPEKVLFGIEGGSPIEVSLRGPAVQSSFGMNIVVRNAKKVAGCFYVGRSSFFERNDAKMQELHRLTFGPKDVEGVQASGKLDGLRTVCAEDVLRSLTAHLFAGPDALGVVPAGGRVRPLLGPPRLPQR